jgi:hypothetical protein
LDDDLMAAFDELIRPRGQQGDAMFLFLDFFGQANDHSVQLRYSSHRRDATGQGDFRTP